MSLKNRSNTYGIKYPSMNAFIPAFVAGMNDSINPIAILGIVLFLIVVLSFGKNWREVLIVGQFFILIYISTGLLSVLGVLDVFMSIDFQLFLRNLLLFIGASAVIFGIINFYDWCLSKRTGRVKKFVIYWPFAVINKEQSVLGNWAKIETKPKVSSFRRLALTGTAFGFLVAVLQMYWAPNELLLLTFFDLYLPGKRIGSVIELFCYCVIYAFPLMVGLFCVIKILKSEKVVRKLQNSVSMIKIVCSSIFIAIGLGIIYLYY